MYPTQPIPAPRTLARLKRQLHELGITHQRVAEEASRTSRRGSVGLATVSRVLSGRDKSANVIDTVKRLITEAKARHKTLAAV